MKIHPIGIAETASLTTNATTLDKAQQVLVQNTTSTGRYIHIEQVDASPARIASFYLQPNQSVLIRKDYDDKIFASANPDGSGAATTVLFTKTGFYA